MITVATFAMNGSIDKAENLANITACIDLAATAGASLVVLPEIGLQGYRSAIGNATRASVLTEIYAGAEQIPDGPSVVAVATQARRRGVHVVYGLTEQGESPGEIYNSAVLTGPDGHIGHYRKVHLGITEQMTWQCGSEWPVFDTELGRIGLLICYDKAWPESCRELVLGGAEILVMPTAWSSDAGRSMAEQYDLYDRVRALENNRWFISSNYSGTLDGRHYFGLSQVINPTGEVVATSGKVGEQVMVTATIDVPGGIRSAYADFIGARILRDRHPETYALIGRQL